jgi:hypothetical protein
MNDQNPVKYKQATRLLIGVCGVLFSLFSFAYLYVFQGDVIEALHYSLAHGRTHYSPLVGAIIITGVLLIFRWAINKLLGLKGPVRALAYFPSCLLLGVLTDVHRDAFHGGGFGGYWQWLLPLVLGVYVGVVFALRRLWRRSLDRELSVGAVWNWNLFLLLLCCSVTIYIGTTGVDFHRELVTEHCIRTQDYSRCMRVGRRSTETTRTLNALRAYALSLHGSMGDSLFIYPQPYGVEGLIFPNDTNLTLRLNNDSLMQYLGAPRRKGESVMHYLERGFNADDGRYTVMDYYLCALLLDKQLDRFAVAAHRNVEAEAMPRHYREALALYRYQHPHLAVGQCDEEMDARLREFMERIREFDSKDEEKNRMRREYGDTYWWYYRYQ